MCIRDSLKGAYGKTPSPVNEMLQKDVLEDGEKPIFCRPADLIAPEIESLETKLDMLSKEMEFELCSKDRKIDDVLTYTLFPNVAIEFFEGRFGAKNVAPSDEVGLPSSNSGSDTDTYTVEVNAKTYIVKVTEGGELGDVYEKPEIVQTESDYGELIEISAPLAGNILNVNVSLDDNVQQGDSLLTLEAMKMETSITAPSAGRVKKIEVRPGDVCAAGQILMVISS